MRKTNSYIYIATGIITIVVFVIGILVGLVIEGKRVEYIQANSEIQRVNFNSIQQQYMYLSSIQSNKSCQVLSKALNNYIKEADKLGARIVQYSEGSNIKSDEFSLLEREYIITQINYWFFARKSKELCNEDYITVLYFYDNDQEDSHRQGFILDYFKKLFKDRILVFSLDSKFKDEPMIEILKSSYDVGYEPSIVVEDTKLGGFQDTETLKSIFCSRYKVKPEGCL